jgi:hypothetical protein
MITDIPITNFSSPYIDHALEVYKSRTHYKPELARSLNLRSTLLRAEGRSDEASKNFDDARKLYTEHMKKIKMDKYMNKVPREGDFDKIVTFWSR